MNYHAGILRGGLHEAWYGGFQIFQQLCVDGGLEEAVEVLAVGEAEEVVAVTAWDRHRQHDGVQQQLHQLLTLQKTTSAQIILMSFEQRGVVFKSLVVLWSNWLPLL